MTKKDFFAFLEHSLDFLTAEEKNNVVEFFLEKFAFCRSEQEEAAIMDAFGAPEFFVESLKTDYQSFEPTENKSFFDFSSYLDQKLFARLLSARTDEDDVIFSKPATSEKSPEIVQSMEDREVKTLYGEKVVVEKGNSLDTTDHSEPIDEANGLSDDDIRIAKAETLEKAESFADKNDPAENKVSFEEEEEEYAEPENEIPLRSFDGVLKSFVNGKISGKSAQLTVLILCSVLLSPILLAIFGIAACAYAVVAAVTILIATVVFLIMVFLIAIAVVVLVEALRTLFGNIAAALIEIGFTTVLFSIVTAISAIIYEFLFGIVPRWLKWITSKFIRYTKLLFCYLYGGKA